MNNLHHLIKIQNIKLHLNLLQAEGGGPAVRGTGIQALGNSPRRRSPPIGGEHLRGENPWAEDKSIFLIKGVFFIFRPVEFRPVDARPILIRFKPSLGISPHHGAEIHGPKIPGPRFYGPKFYGPKITHSSFSLIPTPLLYKSPVHISKARIVDFCERDLICLLATHNYPKIPH